MPRILIYEEDKSLLNLFQLYLEDLGYETECFQRSCICHLQIHQASKCPVDEPCCDAVIIDADYSVLENISTLLDQRLKGCKIPSHNKLILSSIMMEGQSSSLWNMGLSLIRKPFKLAMINEWLESCDVSPGGASDEVSVRFTGAVENVVVDNP